MCHLDNNLNWIHAGKTVDMCVNGDDNATVASKLEALGNLKKYPQNASQKEIEHYIDRNMKILRSIIPLINDCTRDFKHTYLMNNPFIKYMISIVVNQCKVLDTEPLELALELLKALEDAATHHAQLSLITALRKKNGTYKSCLHYCNHLLLLLENTPKKGNVEVCGLVNELLIDGLVKGIDSQVVDTVLSIIYLMNQINTEGAISVYTCLYMEELKKQIFTFDTKTLLNILQFMYRCAYCEDGLYTSTMEALLYKYEFMVHEEKSMLLLLLPYLKHIYLMTTPSISSNIYSEECQMLNTMLRSEFETHIDLMPHNDMINHCLALSLIFKQNSVIRKILVKNIESDMVHSLDGTTFLKLLSCCNTLYINSSAVNISRLFSKIAQKKLASCSGPQLLHGFKCLTQIVARRHRKYLVPLVNDVLEKNKSNCSAIIEVLHLYVSLNMQRYNMTILETGFMLLFPHVSAAMVQSGNTEKLGALALNSDVDFNGSDLPNVVKTTDGLLSVMCLQDKTSEQIDHRCFEQISPAVIYIDKSDSVTEVIPLKGLIKLLQCLTKIELELSYVLTLFSIIQTSIEKQIRYKSDVGFHDLADIIKCLTTSRVVYAKLANGILDRILHCAERLDDPEVAAVMLRFIEFTNNAEYSAKLAQPLFDFCLRKPTAVLMDVLEYQRYKRPLFYAAYMELMQPQSTSVPDGFGGMVKYGLVMGNNANSFPINHKLPHSQAGKRRQILSDWLSKRFEGYAFEEHWMIDNITVDFFYPDIRTVVHILRAQDCFHDGIKCHLKSEMWLFCEILKLKQIRVILVPERCLNQLLSTLK
uniref:RAP domain-containing protein n=2 Tax=Babesia bovis TaxID=5865 RepID=A7AMM1_BABBO|eukprot:XP_001611373.1 hypothetical protein [Babesia bovis T2Bo]